MNWKNLVAIFAFITVSSQGSAMVNGSDISCDVAHESDWTHEAGEGSNTSVTENAKFFKSNAADEVASEGSLLSNRHTVVPETTSITLGLLGLLLILRRRK
ncbi:MAG: hypothetical protein ABI600_00535 [Luteolibacter sp.]